MPFYNPYQYPINNYYQNTSQQYQNGFISVRSEEEARNYPIAPGNSMTFKNESAPYIYTKTMGFSQLDRPTFDKYRLVKENAFLTSPEAHTEAIKEEVINVSSYAEKSEIEAIRKEIDSLWEYIKSMEKEVVSDDE